MKQTGEQPDAGSLPVRFDEGEACVGIHQTSLTTLYGERFLIVEVERFTVSADKS
jgi:hypothetical protein